MNKYPMIKTSLLALIALGVLSLFVYRINDEAHKQSMAIAVKQARITNLQDLADYAATMPNTALRSNIYVLLAAESLMESDQLNVILQEYARMSTERLMREARAAQKNNLQ